MDCCAAFGKLTTDERAEMVTVLGAHCESKATGICSHGLAEIQDVQYTVEHQEDQVNYLTTCNSWDLMTT